MSYYARLRTSLEASLYSDYGKPNQAVTEATFTPDEWLVDRLVEIDTSTTTLSFLMGTITTLVLHNTDAANKVTLTWRSAANGSNDNKEDIAAGKTLVLSDVTASATTMTCIATTAAVLVRVSVLGT